MRRGHVLLLMAMFVVGGKVHSEPAPAACQEQFFDNQMPTWTDSADPRSHVICFSRYGVMTSGKTKTAIWSAEYLTADRVRSAKTIHRQDKFHHEEQVVAADRAELSDYKKAGYDRGHMSPFDDMGDDTSALESFSLANMVPQDPCNNEIIWKAIETATRNYVLANGPVYVVTGPIFDDKDKTIGAGVHVPTRIFKAIYDPKNNLLGVIVTDNKNTQAYDTLFAVQLTEMTGINPFPTVAGTPNLLQLPPLPSLSGSCKKDGKHE